MEREGGGNRISILSYLIRTHPGYFVIVPSFAFAPPHLRSIFQHTLHYLLLTGQTGQKFYLFCAESCSIWSWQNGLIDPKTLVRA